METKIFLVKSDIAYKALFFIKHKMKKKIYVSIRPVFFFQIIWSCLEEIVCLISTEQPEIRFMRKANIICIQKKNGVRCLRFTFTLYILWKVNLTSSKYIKIYTNNNRVIDKNCVYLSFNIKKYTKKKLFQNKRKYIGLTV